MNTEYQECSSTLLDVECQESPSTLLNVEYQESSSTLQSLPGMQHRINMPCDREIEMTTTRRFTFCRFLWMSFKDRRLLLAIVALSWLLGLFFDALGTYIFIYNDEYIHFQRGHQLIQEPFYHKAKNANKCLYIGITLHILSMLIMMLMISYEKRKVTQRMKPDPPPGNNEVMSKAETPYIELQFNEKENIYPSAPPLSFVPQSSALSLYPSAPPLSFVPLSSAFSLYPFAPTLSFVPLSPTPSLYPSNPPLHFVPLYPAPSLSPSAQPLPEEIDFIPSAPTLPYLATY